MEGKLRKYVDELFAETVPTKRAVELKEEMIQNLNDKYSDLLSEGKSPDAAYNIVVAGIGDVSGLLKELETDNYYEPGAYDALQHRSAMFTSIAVVIYILSFLPMLILEFIGFRHSAEIGVPIMFVAIAAATGLLIYNNMTKPRFHKSRETMVDEFRQWQADAHDRKSMRRAISAALWSIIVALYFIISFWTWAWNVTWIIFILGAVAESLINVYYSLRRK